MPPMTPLISASAVWIRSALKPGKNRRVGGCRAGEGVVESVPLADEVPATPAVANNASVRSTNVRRWRASRIWIHPSRPGWAFQFHDVALRIDDVDRRTFAFRAVPRFDIAASDAVLRKMREDFLRFERL